MLIPIVIVAVVPLIAGFLRYLGQKRDLAKAYKPDNTSLKQRLDRE